MLHEADTDTTDPATETTSDVGTRLEQLLDQAPPEPALRRAYSTLDSLALIWAHGEGWRAAGEFDAHTARHAAAAPVRAHAPELTTTAIDPTSVDHAGAGSVAELIRLTQQLLETCSRQPLEQLRAGGVSTKELRRLAAELNAEAATVALLLELCLAAGLLALSDTEDGVSATWLPTVVFDHWSGDTASQRWTSLARSWLTMRRQPSLIEQRDSKTRRIAPLSAEVTHATTPWLRRQLLGCFEHVPNGWVTTPAAVRQSLRWSAPLRIAEEETAPDGSRTEIVNSLITEAATLGLLGIASTAGQRYGLTSFGRELLRGRDPESILAALLPEPVDHVLVQADLTVIAPGPLTSPLAHAMALVAQVESAGAATVYRITAHSLRSAFDSGWTREEVHTFFAESSVTPIPQPLSYLIDDTARRHGGLRVGSALAYLRSDDESLLAAVGGDPRCGQLRLRPLAPTVAITACPPQTLVGVLREAGYAAAAEDSSGALVVRTSQQRRTARSPHLGDDAHPPAPT
ncbi:MAG: helicase-associated domain-containing protein, partial [Mycobacteriales bacterium]